MRAVLGALESMCDDAYNSLLSYAHLAVEPGPGAEDSYNSLLSYAVGGAQGTLAYKATTKPYNSLLSYAHPHLLPCI